MSKEDLHMSNKYKKKKGHIISYQENTNYN